LAEAVRRSAIAGQDLREDARGVLALIDRVARVLDAMGSWLRGAGFVSTDDVFGRVDGGEVGARGGDVDGAIEMEQRGATGRLGKLRRDLLDLAARARQGGAGQVELAPMPRADVDRINAATGLDLTGFRRVIDADDLRHVFNRHGDPATERSRGQLPVRPEDIAALPVALANASHAVIGMKNREGRDLIATLTKLPDGSTLYVEQIGAGRRMLRAKSMRRFPPATSSKDILDGISTPEAAPAGSVKIVDLSVDANDASVTRDRRRNAPPGPFETFETRSARELAAMFLPRNWSALADAKNWNEVGLSLRRTLQDSMIDVRRQQRAIEAARGAPLDLAQDVCLRQSLYAGRTGERLQIDNATRTGSASGRPATATPRHGCSRRSPMGTGAWSGLHPGSAITGRARSPPPRRRKAAYQVAAPWSDAGLDWVLLVSHLMN
jgi:hypothetical protein